MPDDKDQLPSDGDAVKEGVPAPTYEEWVAYSRQASPPPGDPDHGRRGD